MGQRWPALASKDAANPAKPAAATRSVVIKGDEKGKKRSLYDTIFRDNSEFNALIILNFTDNFIGYFCLRHKRIELRSRNWEVYVCENGRKMMMAGLQ
jgi:hypothetical protein